MKAWGEWIVVWSLTLYDVVKDGFNRGVELAHARYDKQHDDTSGLRNR